MMKEGISVNSFPTYFQNANMLQTPLPKLANIDYTFRTSNQRPMQGMICLIMQENFLYTLKS